MFFGVSALSKDSFNIVGMSSIVIALPGLLSYIGRMPQKSTFLTGQIPTGLLFVTGVLYAVDRIEVRHHFLSNSPTF